MLDGHIGRPRHTSLLLPSYLRTVILSITHHTFTSIRTTLLYSWLYNQAVSTTFIEHLVACQSPSYCRLQNRNEKNSSKWVDLYHLRLTRPWLPSTVPILHYHGTTFDHPYDRWKSRRRISERRELSRESLSSWHRLLRTYYPGLLTSGKDVCQISNGTTPIKSSVLVPSGASTSLSE